MANKKKKSNGDILPKSLTFHYVKTDSYRNYHVDGAHGGLTNKGFLQVNLFLERHPIPQTQKLDIQGGEVVESEGKTGVIREVECGLVMDYKTMLDLHQWMGEKIKEYNQIFIPKKVN